MIQTLKSYNRRLYLGGGVLVLSVITCILFYVITAYASDDCWMFYGNNTRNGVLVMREDYDEEDGYENTDYYFTDNFQYEGNMNDTLTRFGISEYQVCDDLYFNRDVYYSRYGTGAVYDTIHVFTAPYSGYFQVECNAPKGQNSSIDCSMHHGVNGSYGSYVKGQVYLNEGEKLLMIMGSQLNIHGDNGPISDSESDSDVESHDGSSVFVFKYINSLNLMDKFNLISSHSDHRSYNNEILIYNGWHDTYWKMGIPNCELLMICGGGNGCSSHCNHLGNDYELNGRPSGFYYNDAYVRNFEGIVGQYVVTDHYWTGNDGSEVDEWGISITNRWLNTNGQIEYEGTYRSADGTRVSVGGHLYEQGLNDVNNSWVKVTSVGNYVYYDANYPSGVVGSGEMLATRVSRELIGALRTNTYNAGENWDFKGWSTSRERANLGIVDYIDGSSIGPIDSDMTLYAVWRPDSYWIHYNSNPPNGYMASGYMPSREVEGGNSTNLDGNAFYVTGYKFAGWSITPNGAITYSDMGYVAPREDNLTVYACWEPITYQVQYNKGSSNN